LHDKDRNEWKSGCPSLGKLGRRETDATMRKGKNEAILKSDWVEPSIYWQGGKRKTIGTSADCLSLKMTVTIVL
jgi:hypothetical protein